MEVRDPTPNRRTNKPNYGIEMKTIIALIDFSDLTKKVIETASQIASSYASTLWLLHVIDPDFAGFEVGPQLGCGTKPAQANTEKSALEGLAKKLEIGEGRIETLLVRGNVVDSVLDESKRLHADLLVTGSHGHGTIYTMVVGSVSNGLLRQSTVPLLIVPHRGHATT